MHPLLAIYPTAQKIEDLLKRLSQEQGIMLGHRLTTFPQITENLWREANIAAVTVGPLGESLALDAAINRVHARNIDLPLIPSAGIRDHLLGIIRQLKSAAVTP